MDRLALIRGRVNRISGHWSEEDYDVVWNGKDVGRIYQSHPTPSGATWFWSLFTVPQHADCYAWTMSREEAMQQFRLRWDRLSKDEVRKIEAFRGPLLTEPPGVDVRRP